MIDGLFLVGVLVVITVYLLARQKRMESKATYNAEKKQMTPNKAISEAILALRQEIRRITVDANLADNFGATYPAALNASCRRRELNQAIQILETLRPKG